MSIETELAQLRAVLPDDAARDVELVLAAPEQKTKQEVAAVVRLGTAVAQAAADKYACHEVLMWAGEWPLRPLPPSRHVAAVLTRLRTSEATVVQLRPLLAETQEKVRRLQDDYAKQGARLTMLEASPGEGDAPVREPFITHAQLAAVVEAYAKEQEAKSEEHAAKSQEEDDAAALSADFCLGRAEGAREVRRRVTGGKVPDMERVRAALEKMEASNQRAVKDWAKVLRKALEGCL